MTEIDRRQFMRRVGAVLIASAGAGLLVEVVTPRSVRWHRVRRCWCNLVDLVFQLPPTRAFPTPLRSLKWDLDQSAAWLEHRRLVAEHEHLIADLVRGQVIREAVGRELHAAFDGAANHRWRSTYAPGCYVAPWSASSDALLGEDLLNQRQALESLGGVTSSATLDRAREAIERDLALLTTREHDEQVRQLLWTAVSARTLPPRADLPDVPEATVEAAHLLVALFAGEL